MRKKRKNPNKGIMFGIMAMALVVLAVVVSFWMWCFPDGTHGAGAERAEYRISVDGSFLGDSVLLQVDDSVVFCRRVASTGTQEVTAAASGEGNLLMVTLPEAGTVSSYELPEGGGRIVLRNRGGTVCMDVSGQDSFE